eukprot:scaffold668611_cov60-Prasinocladus_malaysianus.AAC.1
MSRHNNVMNVAGVRGAGKSQTRTRWRVPVGAYHKVTPIYHCSSGGQSCNMPDIHFIRCTLYICMSTRICSQQASINNIT